ncbi:hypothetical protein [Paraburkholderia rhizosphaerae]|jgi:hypothetical protein|uniref:Serine protease autotransporter n=1 Tax=Paraburkholderia rhizosphaerae TaxID=480658 RepID=A0A4V3HCK0_9BURK|nr:hypothetical protein [Paraburkholderia rhizosphaerae]TDY37364.1 hypothetical protein BX592_1387 [Paraburkholderia rhizosphaerae]
MNKATSALIAAIALAVSGGAFAQNSGGGGEGGGSSSGGSTASPANQVNGVRNSYGTPGSNDSDSGTARKPNSGLPAANSGAANTPAPATNNTLATPSTKSPAAPQ